MLTFVNPQERLATARLLEFLLEKNPWHRSLWGIGDILAMDELYESCAAMRQGHLSEGAIKRIASSLQKRIGIHPAFTDTEKQFLRQQVQQIPRADGAAHHGIRELSARVSSDYLKRWGNAVAASAGTGGLSVEHFARSVAAHLLDAGFAGQYLHGFIKTRLDAKDAISLQQLCNELQEEMLASPSREFEVLLAFSAIPKLQNGIPRTWLQGAAITSWLKAQDFDTSGVRASAAMVLKVHARDEVGAAQAARSESDRYAARARIATGEQLNLIPKLWVKGAAAPVPIKEASRGVGVKELFREDRVFSTGTSQHIDAALELLSHLDGSSPTAAVAGGWGAIEGLLADPSDRATAADNLATLVACSFVRAELTALSYSVQRTLPGQYGELEAQGTNRERSRILAKMIIEGNVPEKLSLADQAAVARLKKIFVTPPSQLQTIREAISESFHRLYRQRNLILHGARLDSVALTASLRTVAKLVGAGMDRITHGHYVQNLKPLELVAKANLGLALVDRDSPLECIDFLETIQPVEKTTKTY